MNLFNEIKRLKFRKSAVLLCVPAGVVVVILSFFFPLVWKVGIALAGGILAVYGLLTDYRLGIRISTLKKKRARKWLRELDTEQREGLAKKFEEEFSKDTRTIACTILERMLLNPGPHRHLTFVQRCKRGSISEDVFWEAALELWAEGFLVRKPRVGYALSEHFWEEAARRCPPPDKATEWLDYYPDNLSATA